ncbi:DEAD/DEAH box helicase family protein (plasmid) [Streptomyces sp. C1-1]|uniref:DEAD/DEAH box helicase family protein n=1 Tax=Streptomyces sp. C1-1 TaxID=3231173 RepID=UPI003D000411
MFFTFDSLYKIEEAQHSAVFPAPVFDLLVVDEAHATAGTWTKNWTALHDNSRIPADRRLYLTATPYVWEAPRLAEPPPPARPPNARPRLPRNGTTPRCWPPWTQPKIFGPRLHTYSHADAIDDGVPGRLPTRRAHAHRRRTAHRAHRSGSRAHSAPHHSPASGHPQVPCESRT